MPRINAAKNFSGVSYVTSKQLEIIEAYTVNGYAINTSPTLNAQDITLTGFTSDANSALTGITASSNVTAAVDKIDEVLAVITGASTVAGSIAKAEADAKAYADGKVSALGSVFNYKGTKATLSELEATVENNKVGDVWIVTNASGVSADQNLEYVCIAVNSQTGAGTWQRLGTNVNLSGYYTKSEIQGFTVNGKTIYTSPTLDGSDIALGSGYSAVTGSVLTNIATGSTIDATIDKVDEILASHASALNTLNGDSSTAGSVAKAVADEATIARAAEGANASAIATLNGSATTAGSVAYAVKAEENARKTELAAELRKYHTDYTAFEVWANSTSVPVGENETLGGYVGVEIPVGMTEKFKIRSNVAPENQTVLVDWGDDSTTELSSLTPSVGSSDLSYTLEHTYSTEGKYIVKILGKDYFNINHAGSNNQNPYNLMCRCMDIDLPIASHLISLASFAYGALRLINVNIPKDAGFVPKVVNWANCFYACNNLNIAKGFEKINSNVYSVSSIFLNCFCLAETDFKLPSAPVSNAIQNIFVRCGEKNPNSAFNVANFFPPKFFVKTMNANMLFTNVMKLAGTVPAKILWEDTSITWTNTEDAFSQCSDAIRAQVPTSWGGTNTEIQAKLDAGYYNKVIKNDIDKINNTIGVESNPSESIIATGIFARLEAVEASIGGGDSGIAAQLAVEVAARSEDDVILKTAVEKAVEIESISKTLTGYTTGTKVAGNQVVTINDLAAGLIVAVLNASGEQVYPTITYSNGVATLVANYEDGDVDATWTIYKTKAITANLVNTVEESSEESAQE